MSSYLLLASFVFLIAFLSCFRPIRTALRPFFAVLGLIMCNVIGIPLGINLFTIAFVTILGIPGICTLLAIYALV